MRLEKERTIQSNCQKSTVHKFEVPICLHLCSLSLTHTQTLSLTMFRLLLISFLAVTSKSSALFVSTGKKYNNNKVSSFSSTSSLASSSSVFFETEDDAQYLYLRAQNCANSDTEECSLDEAQGLLQQLLSIQANCVGGGGGASATDQGGMICNDIDTATEIISKLRARIYRPSSLVGGVQQQQQVNEVGNLFPTSYWPMIFLILFSSIFMIIHFGQEVAMFDGTTTTTQDFLNGKVNEYFSTHDLPEAYFRNGPLF